MGVSGCGPAEPWPGGAEQPGWSGVPDEPANVFVGQAQLRFVNGALQGELERSAGLTQPMYFAVKWQGAAPQRITEVIAPSATTFAGAPFDAPLSVRVPAPNPSCFTAEGRLLAYALREGGTTPDPAGDELVGVGFKPDWLFPFSQAGFNQRITWNSCQPGAGELMPMQFQHDPRFSLALCDDAGERAETLCGQPPLDRTRIIAMDLSVNDEGLVFLSPNFVARVEGPVTYAVNGASFTATAGQLKTQLTGGPWHEGRNRVEVRQGARAPWSAEVVLPVHSLRPRLHEEGLREGDTFTASWDEVPWAQRYSLLSWPLDVPARRVADPSWYTEQPQVTERFPGFRDGLGEPLTPPRAMLRLTVGAAVSAPSPVTSFHSSGGYVVEWSEDLEVAYLP